MFLLLGPAKTAVKISIQNLLLSKMRSFLTILGIIIGVAAVIIIFAVGQSAQKLILDQIKGVGSNLIGILPGASDENGPPAAALGISVTTLTYDDLEAIRDFKTIPEVETGAGYVLGTETVSWDNTKLSASFVGTTASYVQVEEAEVARGRFLKEDEEKNLSRIAVLGYKVSQDIFKGEDPLGKRIKIKDQRFEVIGILKEKSSGGFGSSNQDDTIFIPLKTAQKLILGINHLGFIRLKARNTQDIDRAKTEAATILRDRHDIEDPSQDDFSIRDQAAALEILTKVTDVLRYFLLAVGSIALLVGGIGIMNIMLIAVNQRIREVGLRKALGARSSDIIFQFLIESAAVSLLGGTIGIIIGVSVSFLAAIIIRSLGYEWQFIISPVSLVATTAISIAVGLTFGLYPARKAAKISPMEALRYE